MGDVYLLLLSCLSVAITAQAQECSKPVPNPNMNLKGDDAFLQTFPDGTQVTFACEVGYVSSGGSPTITCTAGFWSPLRLNCKRRSCGSAGEVLNGQVNYPDGNEFGDQAVVTCNKGYSVVGNPKVICGAEGWKGRLASCEVVTCEPPAPVQDATYSPSKDSYNYREVIQYVCQNGLTLSGPSSRTCSADGAFEPGPPSCHSVECDEPNVENGEWDGGSRPPYGYLATVTYKCKSGFTMKGHSNLVCEVNGQWSPGLPTCEKIQTPTKRPTTTTTTTTTTTVSPPVPPGPTDKPDSGTHDLSTTVGIVVGVLIAIIILIIGFLAFKKKRSRNGYPEKGDAKEGEAVALS